MRWVIALKAEAKEIIKQCSEVLITKGISELEAIDRCVPSVDLIRDITFDFDNCIFFENRPNATQMVIWDRVHTCVAR